MYSCCLLDCSDTAIMKELGNVTLGDALVTSTQVSFNHNCRTSLFSAHHLAVLSKSRLNHLVSEQKLMLRVFIY